MIRSRNRATRRGNLENESTRYRGQFRSRNGQRRNAVSNFFQQSNSNNSLHSGVVAEYNSRHQLKNARKNSTRLIEDTSSNDSEDEEYYPMSSLNLSNNHGNCRDGESSNRTLRPRRAGATKHYPSTAEEASNSDSSSDDSVLSPRVAKNLKRPLSSTSTSDSSDSGVPVAPTKSTKRKKVMSSSVSSYSSEVNEQNLSLTSLSSPAQGSFNQRIKRSIQQVQGRPAFNIHNSTKRRLSVEESDSSDSGVPLGSRRYVKRLKVISSSSENDSDEDNQHLNPGASTDKVRLTRYQSARNSIQGIGESSIVRPGSSIHNLDGRNLIEGDENESDPVSTYRTIIGRRSPVIESEDDSSSSVAYDRRGSRALPCQQQSQGVSSVLNPRGVRRRERRNVQFQESENNPSINVSNFDINTPSGRVRQALANIWRVTSQVEETESYFNPISSRHSTIGGRISVVGNEGDSESESASNSEIDGRNEAVNIESPQYTAASGVYNLRRRRVYNYDENSSIQNVNGSNIINSEDELNSSDSDIRPRALSNRILPIIGLQSDSSISSSTDSSPTDSDDSIPIRNRISRSRPVPITDDFDDVTDNFTSGIVSVEKSYPDTKLQNENSSDTDGESEKCPICLTGFKLQEIGKPKSCDHKFCSSCIKEWATKNSSCPIDRKVFDEIVIYDKIEGKIISELLVEKTDQQNDYEVDISNIEDFVAELFSSSESETSWTHPIYGSDGDGEEEICTICNTSSQPHRMMSCDNCFRVFHLGCINPPLQDFPVSNWFCTRCERDYSAYSDSN